MTTRPRLELSALKLVDQHCHPVSRNLGIADPESLGSYFSESEQPRTRTRHVRSTLAYRRTIRRLGELLGCDPDDDDAIVAARAALSDQELATTLLSDAGLEALLVDTGYPPAPRLEPDELAVAAGARAHVVLRLEPLFERHIAAGGDLATLRADIGAELDTVRAAGVVALKSVVAYRGGLAVRRWKTAEADAALRAVHHRGTATRLGPADRPLLDTLLRDALRIAARERLPVQLHTGFGDPDCDLGAADPLLLRELLHDGGADGVDLVLLHFSWPYVRQAAHLAALYDGIWLDADFGVPFLSIDECRQSLKALLALAPVDKIAYSSDGFRIPELHWAAAHTARSVLADVLSDAVSDGDLTAAQAERDARRILSGTAKELYRL